MIISLQRTGESIQGVIEYNTSLYKPSTIERISSHWMRMLEDGISHIDSPISGLDILSDREKEQLLIDFNARASGYPKYNTIPGLFARQVLKTPDLPAVVDVGAGDKGIRTLTYSQLQHQANILACSLMKLYLVVCLLSKQYLVSRLKVLWYAYHTLLTR